MIHCLTRYIPMLAAALLQFNQFHALQQAKAKEELATLHDALAAHVDFFGDSAPMKKDEIDKRIREFTGIVHRSTHVALQLVETQTRVWGTQAKDLLPPSVHQTLVVTFQDLWQQLGGSMREVSRRF